MANGGWVYFNPGKSRLRDSANWTKMTLFDKEQRVPTVADMDGDGLNDLIVGAQQWYKQPTSRKTPGENLGETYDRKKSLAHELYSE